MRELDCDFCGARAAGAYEVIPAELDPAPEEQVRVVLCENCRVTLDSVTAPLLARLGAGGGATPDPAADPAQSTLQSGAGDGSDGSDAAGDGPEDGAQASARSENPVSPADDAVIIDSGGPRSKRKSGGDDSPDTMDASDVAAVRRATAAEQDPLPDESEEDDPVDDPDGGADEGARDVEDAEADDADAGDADPQDADPDEDDGESEASGTGEPEEFRTVMRLLNNREFPVDRGEITDLASGAYELEVSEVEAIIDHAIERGILAENRGKLTKA